MPTWREKQLKSFCQDETILVPFDQYSPDQIDYYKAKTLCQAMGGHMAMPHSLQDEQTRWTQQLATYSPRYRVKMRSFFLPVTDNETPDAWINDLTGRETTYTNWQALDPNGGMVENCTVIEIMNPESKTNE